MLRCYSLSIRTDERLYAMCDLLSRRERKNIPTRRSPFVMSDETTAILMVIGNITSKVRFDVPAGFAATTEKCAVYSPSTKKNRNREWKIKIFTDRSKTIKFFFSVKFSFIYRDINHLPCKNSKIFDGREHNALGTCKRNIDLYIFEITPRTIV